MPIQRFLKASRIYRQKSLSPNRTAVTSLLTGEPTRVYTGEALLEATRRNIGTRLEKFTKPLFVFMSADKSRMFVFLKF